MLFIHHVWICQLYILWVDAEDLTWVVATVVQLTEMSGTSYSGCFVCLLWKGWLNGSLVTNSTWKLTSIYSHFLSIVLHSCLSTKLVSRVCPFQSWIPLDFQQSAATNTPSIPSKFKAHVQVCFFSLIHTV